MKRKVTLLLVAGLISLTPASLMADTPVGGLICDDTTWDPEGSPYVVTSSITVSGGATLTIEADVEVRFHNAKGLTIGHGVQMCPDPNLAGTLVARGTEGAEIRFTTNDPYEDPPGTADPGDWVRICLTGTTTISPGASWSTSSSNTLATAAMPSRRRTARCTWPTARFTTTRTAESG